MITEYWINKVFDENIEKATKDNRIIGYIIAVFLEDLRQEILKGVKEILKNPTMNRKTSSRCT